MAVDLPPPTYLLLVGLTCAAWPLILRGTPPGSRRPIRLLLMAALGVEASLALLYYSVPLCAVGVVLSAAAFGRVGFPDSWPATLASAVPAALAGAAFMLQPEPESFTLYFALGLPLSLAVALAAASQRWLRWAGGWRMQAAAAALVAFATFVPASFFSVRFGQLFELWHAPVLLSWLAALAFFARRGESARMQAIGAQSSTAEGVRYPGATGRMGVGAVGVVGLLSVLAAAWTFAGRIAPADDATEIALLVLLSVLATAFAVLAMRLLSISVRRAEAARALRTPWAGPDASKGMRLGFSERVQGLPSAADLEGFRSRLVRSGHAAGALVAENPDPLATLDEAAEAWLEAQQGPGRVHLVVREGRDEFVLPPLVPGEATP